MDHPCASMPTMHRTIVVVAMALLVLGQASSALAQQTAPAAPKAQAKKPSTSLPAAPATSQPTAPPATAQPQGADVTKQPFIFSPWTKICGKDGPENTNAKDVCAVLTEARVPGGQIAV